MYKLRVCLLHFLGFVSCFDQFVVDKSPRKLHHFSFLRDSFSYQQHQYVSTSSICFQDQRKKETLRIML
ncbi:hypothetical protein GcM1_c11848o57 [Golovinomyces cichoracearum]|uniref:Secreted protein n=1 Tax=Golovinomyces cichoracearum TaxID=62708 RepID=A0A420IEL2_9PEZI|nr:hypothetical protein GcM1_c11848o57 [Golovinomyces cichoracearum]